MVWEDDRGSSIFRAEEVRGGSLAEECRYLFGTVSSGDESARR
jgi:hypothetical protein